MADQETPEGGAAALDLRESEFRDRVLGGWLGKNIGSTLGGPYEGRTTPLGLTFYDPLPDRASPNDDLDLELLWLHALEKHGVGLTAVELAHEWLDHMRYPWDEYAYATLNLRRGLNPPLSGRFGNWFKDSMGATIRSEIWAMVAPGAPDVAAALARQDAELDHSGEGVWAAVFLAALESAAFFLHDVPGLLTVGLARIPPECRVARAIRVVQRARAAGKSAIEARAAVLEEVGSPNVTDAPQNLGFIVLGLLYGEGDFGSTICAAVNCGYDTDTTGATVGAILGIMNGRTTMPDSWLEPIGDAITVGWGIEGVPTPGTVQELTDRTVAVARSMVEARCPQVRLVADEAPMEVPAPEEPQVLPALNVSDASEGPAARPATQIRFPAPTPPVEAEATWSLYRAGSLEVRLDMGPEGPAVSPGKARSLVVEMRNPGARTFEGSVRLEGAEGWRLAVPGAQSPGVSIPPGKRVRLGYALQPPDDCTDAANAVRLVLEGRSGRAHVLRVPFVPAGCWWVVGPLKNEFGGGFERGYPVEPGLKLDDQYLGRGDGLVGWQRMAFAESVLEIEPVFSGLPGVAYLYTVLRWPADQDIRLIAHTNDGMRIWLNERLVYQIHDHGDFRPSLCSGPGAAVKLRSGENRLLVKVVRCDRPASLALSLVDLDGAPLVQWGNHRW